MSPLEACAEILSHLRDAWEKRMEGYPFAEQQILVTVPASFDSSARQLVQEAASLAGYPEIILLEEPQAAFYAWLHQREKEWRQQLKVGDTILVIDIGGGTTDFSLIEVENEEGSLGLKRLAVGSHLLLGGDNIDLSLAYLAKGKLEEQGHVLDEWQFHSLLPACRKAKEEFLSAEPPVEREITIMGRGSRLVGGSLQTTISKEEAHQLILDGFAPVISPEERRRSRNG